MKAARNDGVPTLRKKCNGDNVKKTVRDLTTTSVHTKQKNIRNDTSLIRDTVLSAMPFVRQSLKNNARQNRPERARLSQVVSLHLKTNYGHNGFVVTPF